MRFPSQGRGPGPRTPRPGPGTRESGPGQEEPWPNSPASLFILLRGEDVCAKLYDVLPPQRTQLAQPDLQLAVATLQQFPQAAVVTLDLVPLLLVAAGPALQSLALLLRALEAVLICKEEE